jgi:alpha-1,2-mannosyltransferase
LSISDIVEKDTVPGSVKEKKPKENEKFVDFDETGRNLHLIVSIGQFRPEKDHKLQLLSLSHYLNKYPLERKLKLIMIGSCRGQEDKFRVESLRNFAVKDLALQEGIDFEFKIDCSKEEMDNLFEHALIGLHTMWNEHFGIGIVEMMARGLIVVAHNSGGPKSDIIHQGVDGFLASTDEEYATTFMEISSRLNQTDLRSIRREAKKSIARFTEEEFGKKFVEAIQPLIG